MKKVKNRIFLLVISIVIVLTTIFNIGCTTVQPISDISEKIKDLITDVEFDIDIAPIFAAIEDIEKEYLYDVKREELVYSAFEGIIKNIGEKYPELLSAQDKVGLRKIRDEYPEDSLDSIEELIKELMQKKDVIKVKDLIMYASKSMIESLNDKYAYFFYPENYGILMQDFSGYFYGVGMFVNQVDDKIVVQPIEGMPAYKAGIKSGDEILEVNGKSIKGISVEEVVILIRGEEGTKVTITFFRPDTNEKFTKELVRERIEIPNHFKIEVIDEKIGYVNYFSFKLNGDASDFKKKLEKLSDEGVKVLILDLRGNSGGLLSEAVDLARIFIDEGIIVIVKEKKSTITYSGKDTKYAEIPLVVIVDKGSASASEIFAGAIQYHNRAKLVGNTTFGKGTVQKIYSLPDGSGIKFTTADYFLSSDKSINEVGVIPDIIVEDDKETEEVDEQLEAAKKIALEIIEENKTSQINKDGK